MGLKRFFETVRGVLLHPAAFFAELPRSGSLTGPLLFALVCILVSGVLKELLRVVLLGFGVAVYPPGPALLMVFFGAPLLDSSRPLETLLGQSEL